MSFLRTSQTIDLDDAIRMPVIGLSIGMRITAIDKPWEEGNYRRSPFTIETQRDLEAMRVECEYVYVEQERDTVGTSIMRPGGYSRSSKHNIDPGPWSF